MNRPFFLSLVLILSISVAELLSYRDVNTPAPVVKQWWETKRHTHIYIYVGLLSVSVYQIHSQSFGWPEAIIADNCLRCHTVGLNPEPYCWKENFLPHSHACPYSTKNYY
ncbi:Hypothetical predicted protein [Octopus vulgaris]|uniref:Uncharacterized protein n=1 Tax=Octopus vulgaris TaxID=6645 RepID=A0AA36FCR3_OCTVU|nr:Hypothetical predicted protein [Octopus vulgaris]